MANRLLKQIIRKYWNTTLKYHPSLSTFLGYHRFNHLLEDLGPSQEKRSINLCKATLKALKKVELPKLTEQEKISVEILEERLSLSLKMNKFPGKALAIDQMEGPIFTFLQIAAVAPFRKPKDFRNYLARLKGFRKMVAQIRKLLLWGIKKGWTQPKVIVEETIKVFSGFIKPEPMDSQFFAPVRDKIKTQKQGERLGKNILKVIIREVYPSIQALIRFINNVYLPKCRTECGLGTLPKGGKDFYQLCIQRETSCDLTPEQIHAIGKKELKRIHQEMEEVMAQLKFKGSLQDFFAHVRGQKKSHYSTSAEMVEGHKKVLAEMDKKLPAYFHRLPKNPYKVLPMEPYREKSAPDAYYMQGSIKAKRPGIYYVNTYQPETRGRHFTEVLAYHEAVPGHHLQTALAQEIMSVPEFRKVGGYNSFVEGWALYSEKLAQEMGFYKDSLSLFGRLSFEAWRAARLVVDTGLHAMNWTRDKAIKFFRENSGLSEANIEVEVNRYMVLPAQALSYKLGEIKIFELREMAKTQLGPLFNIADFHEALLSSGAIPLPTLERVIHEWLQSVPLD